MEILRSAYDENGQLERRYRSDSAFHNFNFRIKQRLIDGIPHPTIQCITEAGDPRSKILLMETLNSMRRLFGDTGVIINSATVPDLTNDKILTSDTYRSIFLLNSVELGIRVILTRKPLYRLGGKSTQDEILGLRRYPTCIISTSAFEQYGSRTTPMIKNLAIMLVVFHWVGHWRYDLINRGEYKSEFDVHCPSDMCVMNEGLVYGGRTQEIIERLIQRAEYIINGDKTQKKTSKLICNDCVREGTARMRIIRSIQERLEEATSDEDIGRVFKMFSILYGGRAF